MLVSVTGSEALVCRVRLPKFSEVALELSKRVCATPVPETMTLSDGVAALLVKSKVPAIVAAELGSKLIVKAELPPGVMVSGKAIPVSVKPEPLSDACEIVRLAVPGFFTVMVCVLVTPTLTLPKLTLVGTTVICGCTPVAENEMVVGEFVALLTKVMPPEDDPATVGAKMIGMVRLCPAARVTGRVTPLSVKPVPVKLICEMVTLEFPVLETVTD